MQISIRLSEQWEKAVALYMLIYGTQNRHRAILELIRIGLDKSNILVDMPPERGRYPRS